MSSANDPSGRPDDADVYEIRLKGHLDARWAAWFDGLALTQEVDGSTVIRGSVVDQAALHGLLHKVRDIALPILSVTRLNAVNPKPQPNPEPRKPETRQGA